MDAREITFRLAGIAILSLGMAIVGCHGSGKARAIDKSKSSLATTRAGANRAGANRAGANRASAKHKSTTHPSTTQTLLDVRRGTGSFPLVGEAHSAADLQTALTKGYRLRLTPTTQDFIAVTGDWPRIHSLHVDVSGAKVHPNYRPARFDKQVTGESSLKVDELDYVAHPLEYENMRMNVHLSARDASMDILHDSANHRGLVLAGARKGRMDFSISEADSQGLLTVGGSKGGEDEGVSIDETRISFVSDSPHSMHAAVHVRARWLILPMSFRVYADLHVTDDGTVTYSNVGADGENPGGNLAAAFLSPYLKKMNGQTQQMVAFSDEKTHVTSVRFGTNDGVQLSVEFGRK